MITKTGQEPLVDGAEHALQAVAGAALQGLALLLHGIARQPVHAREELIVHFDDLIDQRLAGLEQVAGHQRVPLRLGETAQVTGIVAPPELAELSDDIRTDLLKARARAEQLFDKPQPDNVALDHSGACRFLVVLKSEQAGARVSFRHLKQQIDVCPQFLRQPFGYRCKKVERRVGDDRGNHAFERAGAGQDHEPAAQLCLGLHQQLGAGSPLDGARPQPVAQFLFRLLVEAAQAQVTADALCLDALRRFAP